MGKLNTSLKEFLFLLCILLSMGLCLWQCWTPPNLHPLTSQRRGSPYGQPKPLGLHPCWYEILEKMGLKLEFFFSRGIITPPLGPSPCHISKATLRSHLRSMSDRKFFQGCIVSSFFYSFNFPIEQAIKGFKWIEHKCGYMIYLIITDMFWSRCIFRAIWLLACHITYLGIDSR